MWARIPADVDRDDTLVAGLTARQLGLVAVPAVALWLLFTATRHLVPPTVFGFLALPVAAASVTLAVGRWHGLGADRFALAVLRYVGAPRRLVPAPDGVPALPAWARGADRSRPPAALSLPVGDMAADGVQDLGPDGASLRCVVSPVNFRLRTEDEQVALIAGFGRFVNSLSTPVEISVHDERTNLDGAIREIETGAASLADPMLEAAALDHARFLAELAGRRDVVRRRILLVFRDPAPRTDTTAAALARRASDAAAALAAIGISLTPLDEPAATAELRAAADPDRATTRIPDGAP
jgi:hypothetical protein